MTTLVNAQPPVRVVIQHRAPLVMTPRSNTGGPAGGGGISPYVQNFFTPANTWTINHNLGRKVDVVAFTMGSVKMVAEVVLITDNQAVVVFAQPTAGFARVI